MFNNCFLVLMLCVTIVLMGCTNNEIRNKKALSPDAVYFDYSVWGDEESGYVTAKFQYRSGGPAGTALVLEDPAKVEFDGEPVTVDSSRMNGAWYEVSKALQDFDGKHHVIYTDGNNKQYREEFDFKIFSLVAEIPRELKREDLVFELDGLAPEEYINVLLTDTSFYSRGIDRLDTVHNGRIVITRQDLDNLKNGPISLEFYLEDEKSLKEATKEGGRLSTSYGLKRVFELKD